MDSMSLKFPRMYEKILWRWDLKTSQTGVSARHYQFTLYKVCLAASAAI